MAFLYQSASSNKIKGPQFFDCFFTSQQKQKNITALAPYTHKIYVKFFCPYTHKIYVKFFRFFFFHTHRSSSPEIKKSKILSFFKSKKVKFFRLFFFHTHRSSSPRNQKQPRNSRKFTGYSCTTRCLFKSYTWTLLLDV